MAEERNVIFPLTQKGEKLADVMGVTPLKADQIARYKLIESDEDDRTRTDFEGRQFLKKTPGWTMIGLKRIFDPVNKRSVFIQTKTVEKTIKSPLGDFTKSEPGRIYFTSQKPMIEVDQYQPELYAFLERANENRDNPFRNPKVKARYYRVDPRKKLEMGMEKDDFEVRAMNWVWTAASYEELLACANYANKVNPSLHIKTDYTLAESTHGFGMLKRALLDLAKKDPHTVIKGSTNVEAQIRMQIVEAEKMQIILFNDGKKTRSNANTWCYNDGPLSTICTIEAGKDKYEELMKFFLDETKGGGKHYTKIVGSLKDFLAPKPR